MARQRIPSDISNFADNCEACGQECLKNDLNYVVLSNVNWRLRLCKVCVSKDCLADYKEAIKIIKKNG